MTDEPDVFEPLVPPDVDLTGYLFTPLFRARLFGSEFHATATDSEWRAGVTLWLKSWDQQPAGTLPPNDRLLAKLAEMPMDAWMAVRDVAMHGWRMCSDGRLHHAVVAEGVLEAWAGKKKLAANGAKGAAKRWGLKTKTKNSRAIAGPMAPQWRGYSNGEGEGEGKGKTLLRNGATAPKADFQGSTPPENGANPTKKSGGDGAQKPVSADHSTWLFNEGLSWLAKAAKKNPNSMRSLIGKWRRDLHDDDAKLRAIFESGIAHNPIDPVSWLTQAITARAKQNGHTAPLPDPDALGEDDLFLAKVFGGIATDTLLYRREGLWPEFMHGPKPDQPGNKVPPVVLSRHGYADAGIYAAWKGKPPG